MKHAVIHTCVHTYNKHTYTHSQIHTYTYTCRHTYTHTYTQLNSLSSCATCSSAQHVHLRNVFICARAQARATLARRGAAPKVFGVSPLPSSPIPRSEEEEAREASAWVIAAALRIAALARALQWRRTSNQARRAPQPRRSKPQLRPTSPTRSASPTVIGARRVADQRRRKSAATEDATCVLAAVGAILLATAALRCRGRNFQYQPAAEQDEDKFCERDLWREANFRRAFGHWNCDEEDNGDEDNYEELRRRHAN